jgi:nicotinate-nucleotide adenylyltransferase
MKIGLFFGSFNPIHIGHLVIANTMATSTDLEQVWFIVSPQNPFKKNNSLLHEFDRYTMVERAIADNHKLKVSDIEFSLTKPSYTIDTLTVLTDKYPEHEFVLIMGEDNLVQFENWKNFEKILEFYKIYVYPRPNTPQQKYSHHTSVKFVEAPLLDISATYIRKRLQEHKNIKYLVTDPVEAYIELKKFYI